MSATELPGGVYPNVDVITKWYGDVGIMALWNDGLGVNPQIRIMLETTRSYAGGSKVVSHQQEVSIAWLTDQAMCFPLSRFDTVSRVVVGPYQPDGGGDPFEITADDLAGPVTLSYTLRIRAYLGALADGPDPVPFSLDWLEWRGVATRMHQLGEASRVQIPGLTEADIDARVKAVAAEGLTDQLVKLLADVDVLQNRTCLLYTSPSPRDS